MPENTQNICDYLIPQLRIKLEAITNRNSRQSAAQSLDSFTKFLLTLPPEQPISNPIANWILHLLAQQYTPKTIIQYLDRLSSLLPKEKLLPKENQSHKSIKSQLSNAKSILTNLTPQAGELLSQQEIFTKLRRIITTESKNDIQQLSKDILILTICSGGMTLDQIANLRKDDPLPLNNPAISEILQRYSRPKNKYLLPLKQSERTPAQRRKAVALLIHSALRNAGIHLSEITPNITIDLWQLLALQFGLSPRLISQCNSNKGLLTDLLNLNNESRDSNPADESNQPSNEIILQISTMLMRDSEGWFAMQFRPNVSYDTIKKRIADKQLPLRETFYPMEEIVRRIGNRLQKQQRPIVNGLLLFRAKTSSLPGIFHHLGDIAWGYRQSRDRQSPYALIPDRAIADYQTAIGQFTNAIKEYPDGQLQFQPGSQVTIASGPLIGLTATYEKEIRLTDGQAPKLMCRLRFSGDNCITWTADLDPRQLLPKH